MLLAVGAIGLLKLQKWSYPLVLGVQSFWLISAAVSTLSPTYTGIMQGLLSEMQPPTAAAIAFSVGQLRFMSFIGILFSLLILGILVFYRRRFMEAASARAVQPRS
jgi:type II secretory pathway component PulF